MHRHGCAGTKIHIATAPRSPVQDLAALELGIASTALATEELQSRHKTGDSRWLQTVKPSETAWISISVLTFVKGFAGIVPNGSFEERFKTGRWGSFTDDYGELL